jgi:hypothetical protein
LATAAPISRVCARYFSTGDQKSFALDWSKTLPKCSENALKTGPLKSYLSGKSILRWKNVPQIEGIGGPTVLTAAEYRKLLQERRSRALAQITERKELVRRNVKARLDKTTLSEEFKNHSNFGPCQAHL